SLRILANLIYETWTGRPGFRSVRGCIFLRYMKPGGVWADGRGASVVRHGNLHAEEEAAASTSAAAQSARGRGAAAIRDLEQILAAALAEDADVEALARQLAQLLESGRERFNADIQFLDVAAKCKELLISQLRSIGEAMASMAQRLESLEREGSISVQSREKILLGQVAYVVDLAAASYVFAVPQPPFTTLSQLLSYRTRGELSAAQVQRFDDFAAFLDKQGWDLELLIETIGALNSIRVEIAHGDPAEQASVTEDSLLEWSNRYLDPIAVQRFKRLLPVIRLLTEPVKPLVLRSNMCNTVL
ncbi:hypothetical protein Vretifemale_14246, partial [Volvox reticuliferus]